MSLTDAVMPTRGWRKASYSVNNGQCVETASARGAVMVRDSADNSESLVVSYPVQSWRTFLASTKAGNFDVIR